MRRKAFSAIVRSVLYCVRSNGGFDLDADGVVQMSSRDMHRALLGSDGCYTSFSYGQSVIRFRTPCSLRRYLRVKEWDRGYLVVDADYEGIASPVEEYIDLVPILQNLYIDPNEFLEPIEEVCVR